MNINEKEHEHPRDAVVVVPPSPPQQPTPEDIDRIIEMAWEDRTPFEAITAQFGLSEQDVIRLMKQQLRPKSWQKWRARVQGRKTKHAGLREDGVQRFKSKAQRTISGNRISKKTW